MKNDEINILVTFDQNYVNPFLVMFKSMVSNHPQEIFHVWLLHSAILGPKLQMLKDYCKFHQVELTPIQVDRTFFKNAPISKQYPQEMYYRLLAPQLLPESLERILYIDPDILVINPVRPLWEMNLNGKAFAAASHTGVFDVMNDVNRVRLGTEHDYYNSGVMLMDLSQARKLVKADGIGLCDDSRGRRERSDAA